MKRFIVPLTSTAMVVGAYFAGATISSMVTNNGAEASVQQQCSPFCDGSGGAGQIGESVTIKMPAGGAGGSVAGR